MRNAESGARKGKIVSGFVIAVAIAFQTYAGQAQHIGQKLPALEKIPPKFSFVVLGDTRTGDAVYRKLLALAMARKPAFIVNVGDQIAQAGNREQWANFWELSKGVAVPYFLTVGNHDVHPEVPGSEKTYRDEVDLPGNELYYSFIAGNSLFIVLDSYLYDQEKKITGEQFKWLEGVLENSKQKHKFVFLHHPLYTDPGKGKHAGDCIDKYPKDRDLLKTLFAKSKVEAVYTSHEHFYQRKVVDGVTYIITGGGGAPLYGREKDNAFHHFILVEVDSDKVNTEVVDIRGRVRDRF